MKEIGHPGWHINMICYYWEDFILKFETLQMECMISGGFSFILDTFNVGSEDLLFM